MWPVSRPPVTVATGRVTAAVDPTGYTTATRPVTDACDGDSPSHRGDGWTNTDKASDERAEAAGAA